MSLSRKERICVMTKKKIFLRIVLIVAFLLICFVGYYFVRYLCATSRMKELSDQLELKIQVWEKKEYKRPPLKEPAIPGNAAQFYHETLDKLEQDTDNFCISISDAVSYPDKPLTGEARAYFERNKYLSDIIAKGVNAEIYKPLATIREDKIPDFLKLRTVINIMILQARDFEQHNQLAEAIKNYCSIFRLGQDYNRGEVNSYSMYGTAISEMSYEELVRLMHTNKLSNQNLIELITYLKILSDSEPVLSECWEAQQLSMEKRFETMAQIRCIIPEPDTHRQFSNRTTFVDDWDYALRYLPEVISIIDLPYNQYKSQGEALDKKIFNSKHLFCCLMFPGIVGSKDDWTRMLTYRHGIHILAGIQLYNTRYQKYPDNLSALSPEIIPSISLDPFSDKPFIYRVDKDGKMYLYSVGANLKDDGGSEKDDILISPMGKGK